MRPKLTVNFFDSQLFRLSILGVLFFNFSLYAQTQSEIAAQLIKRLVLRQAGNIYSQATYRWPVWIDEVDAVFTQVLTLEAQEAFRNSHKVLTGRILVDLRASWFSRFKTNSMREVVSVSEQRASQNLERLYRKLGKIFKSPDELIQYIEKENLVQKGLISAEDYLFIRGFKYQYFSDASFTFRSLQELRSGELRKEIQEILEKAGAPIEETLEKITLVFRNLSNHNQFLWTFAEARFSLKLQYGFWYLWTNHFSKVPRLKTKWLRFWKRWQLKKIIKFPSHTPQDETELMNFFVEFTKLLADSLAYQDPRSILTLPWNYVRRATEKHARVLAADFEMMQGLKDLSPEIGLALKQKTLAQVTLLKLEHIFDNAQGPGMPGFEALLEAIRKEGQGDLEKGLIHILKPIQGGYGTWAWNHVILAMFILTSIQGFCEEDISAPPIYPGDRDPFAIDLSEFEKQEHSDSAPIKPIGDVYIEVIIRYLEEEVQQLKENPEENEMLIRTKQKELEQLYQLNPEVQKP